MKGLFRYPEKAKFGRIIPKAKIYEHAKLKPAQKAQFIDLNKMGLQISARNNQPVSHG